MSIKDWIFMKEDELNKTCYEAVMTSGIILDEDMELICRRCESNEYPLKGANKYPYYEIITGTMSAAASSLVLKEDFTSVVLGAVASVPLIAIVIKALKQLFQRKFLKEVTLKHVEAVKRIIRFHTELIEFVIGESMKNINTFNNRVKECISFIVQTQVELLAELRAFIRTFNNLAPFLKIDCSYLNLVKLEEVTKMPLNDYRDSAEAIMKIRDIFLAFMSLMMTGWALAFCPEVWNGNENMWVVIQNKLLPEVHIVTITTIDAISKRFISTKFYHMENFKNTRDKFLPMMPKRGGDKTIAKTYNVLSMTNGIMENSLSLFNKLNEINGEADFTLEKKKEISALIKGLRSQADEYCSALEMIDSVFDVLVNGSQPRARPEDSEASGSAQACEGDGDQEIKVICPVAQDFNADSEYELRDEEFELVLGSGEPQPSTGNFMHSDEDHANVLAKALTKELTHDLTTDKRFAASRRKWGVQVNESISTPTISGQDTNESTTGEATIVGVQSLPIFPTDKLPAQVLAPPMPPPLPAVPLISSQDTQIKDDEEPTFLSSLLKLSAARLQDTEVFGSDCEEQ